jgi:N-dimethylarginine dimethylaminohydrolase
MPITELSSPRKFKWEAAQTVEECERIIQENTAAINQWQAEHPSVVVMCPPTYFDIVETQCVGGNGFLIEGSSEYQKDKDRNLYIMNQDWRSFQTQLTQRGVKVVNMEPRPGLVDEVFTADQSQSYVFVTRANGKLVESNSITVFSNFAHPGRVNETKEAVDMFSAISKQAGFAGMFENRTFIHAEQKMEGTGDNLIDPYRGIIVSGYGKRNSAESLGELHEKTGIPVYGIKSQEPFFHVDTYTCILPGGYVLYAPEVMNEEGIKQLDAALFKNLPELKEKYGIVVSKQDAEAFVCNAVIVGDEIIMQPCSEVLKKAIQSKGLKVSFAPAQIANLSGGGFHCMTNKINQPIFYSQNLPEPQRVQENIVAEEYARIGNFGVFGKPSTMTDTCKHEFKRVTL